MRVSKWRRKGRAAGDARFHTDFSFVLSGEHFPSLFIVLPLPISRNVLFTLNKDIGWNFFSLVALLLSLSLSFFLLRRRETHNRTVEEWLIFLLLLLLLPFLFRIWSIYTQTHTHTHTHARTTKKKQTNHRDESRINLLLNGECLGRDVWMLKTPRNSTYVNEKRCCLYLEQSSPR